MAPLSMEDSALAASIHPPGSLSSPSSFSLSAKETPSGDLFEAGFTAPLLARMAASRSKFDAWIESQRARADAADAANKDILGRERGELGSMRRDLVRIRTQLGELADAEEEDGGVESAARRKEALLAKQAKAERAIATLHMTRRERQRELEEAAQEESVQRLRAQVVRQNKERVSELKEVTMDDLTVGVIKYRSLGLTFFKSSENSSLRFSFTQIDRCDPQRRFDFTLCVNEVEDWEVEDCEPPLRAGAIVRLVDELNSNNDIGLFVRGMRKEFKATVFS